MSANSYVACSKYNKILLIGTVCFLTACGGGGGGGDSSNSNNNGNNTGGGSTTNQAPTNVALTTVSTSSTSSVLVEWNSATDDSTTSTALTYEVYVAEGGDFTPNSSNLSFSAKNVLNTVINSLKADTTYTIKLAVVDKEGSRTVSSGKTVKTLAVTTPVNLPPTQVSLTKVVANSSTSLLVEWSAASDDNTATNELLYEVHLIEGNSDFTVDSSNLKFSAKNVLSTQITGLKEQTSYTVKLLVKDAAGLSTASTFLTATTLTNSVPVVDKINDSGITQCANDNTLFSQCNGANLGGWFGLQQDGEKGRDSLATQGLLVKQGSGLAGFDFSKLDSAGSQIANNASTWSCVKDNLTGLVWEAKTNDGGVHDYDTTYAWYNTNTSNNGGFEGEKKTNNTQDFMATVNTQGLCGFKDWRLPTRQELETIVHYGQTTEAMIDNGLFPNTQKGLYWTSVPVASNPTSAWALSFLTAGDSQAYKGSSLYVRLVRGTQL